MFNSKLQRCLYEYGFYNVSTKLSDKIWIVFFFQKKSMNCFKSKIKTNSARTPSHSLISVIIKYLLLNRIIIKTELQLMYTVWRFKLTELI